MSEELYYIDIPQRTCITMFQTFSLLFLSKNLLWKRLNTETSQRGNASKTGFEEFPFFWEIPQNWKMLRDFRIFLRRFLIFKVEVFPLYF